MRETRKNKTIHFVFLKSINRVLLVSLILAVILTGIVAFILNAQDKFQDLTLATIVIINVLLISLPIVLFILCIVSSALFSGNLFKKKVSINKFSRFESLLNIDVLCLEKGNIIVDGSLAIKKVIPLKSTATEQYINQWLSNMLRATNDEGVVFDTLNKQYDFELSAGVISVLHYNSQLKYNGASFKGGKTIVLGNPEYVPIKNKIGILKRCEEDVAKGCQILVVAEGREQISDSGYNGELEAIALIILKNHVRDGALTTFKWFKDNNIDIKVVSSDNAFVTSVNAAEAGLDGADKYISLAGVEANRIGSLVSQYTVFGDATPEQKEAIINSLKRNRQVMMIGGNESNILSMKAANFAAATICSDAISQKAADIVLESSSLEPLPIAINSSKSFVNNLEKILSLSLAKTALAFVIALFFIAFNNSLKQCLFVFNHLLLWDLITNGVALFMLAFDKNNKKVDNVFLKNVLNKAIPIMILQIVGVLTAFLLYAMQYNQLLSIGLYSINNVAVICILIFTVFGITSLYNVCVPLNRYRRIAVIFGAFINVIAVAVIMLIAYLSKNEEIPYVDMNGPAYFIAAIIAIIYSSIYLFVNRIISIFKGDNLENEN